MLEPKKIITGLAVAWLMAWASPTLAAGDVEHGKTLGVPCMACHGVENLKLDPRFSVPKLWKQNPSYLFNALKAYKSGARRNAMMQALVAPLNEQDMRDLAAYFGTVDRASARVALPAADVSTVASSAPRAPSENINAPKITVEICSSCHGATGGATSGIAALAGQYADYLSYALNQYRSGQRKHPVMSAIAKSLAPRNIAEAANFYSRFTEANFSLQAVISKDAVWTRQNPIFDAASDAPFIKTTAQPIPDIAMANLAGGEFVMGGEPNDNLQPGLPKHTVHIAPFRMGQYEVTFEQYDAFARDTKRALPDDTGWGRGSRPVINISWADTQAFIAWLNKNSGRHFRLPSEAEWEYAARAGTTTMYWWGEDMDTERFNYAGISKHDLWQYTAPVGQFEPNAFGLYDTAGNVWERVADCWHSNYESAPTDGSAWLGKPCSFRVNRGGSWNITGSGARSGGRSGVGDGFSSIEIGFRLAEDIATARSDLIRVLGLPHPT